MISTDELFKLIEKYLFAFKSKEDAIKYIFNGNISTYTKMTYEEIENSINSNLTKYFNKEFKSKKLPSIIKKYVKNKTLTKDDLLFLDNIIIGCEYEYTFDDLEKISSIKQIKEYLNKYSDDETSLIQNIKDFNNIDELSNEKKDFEETCDDLFKIYIKDVKKYGLLTASEQLELMKRYKKNNDPEAFEKLVCCNQGLCIEVAKKYLNRGLSLLDLIQEGTIGLMKGIDKFDLGRKTKVSTYVTWWIRQAITLAVNENNTAIRIPKSMKDKQKKLEKQENSFMERNGRKPTIEELIELTGFTEKMIKDIKKYNVNIFSIDKQIQTDDDNGSTYGDFIESTLESPNESVEKEERIKILNRYLETLGKDNNLSSAKRIEQILRLRFGVDVYNGEIYKIIEKSGFEFKDTYTLTEIGKMYNVKGERIRQLEAKGIYRLKKYGIVENFLLDNGERIPTPKVKYKYKNKSKTEE